MKIFLSVLAFLFLVGCANSPWIGRSNSETAHRIDILEMKMEVMRDDLEEIMENAGSAP